MFKDCVLPEDILWFSRDFSAGRHVFRVGFGDSRFFSSVFTRLLRSYVHRLFAVLLGVVPGFSLLSTRQTINKTFI